MQKGIHTSMNLNSEAIAMHVSLVDNNNHVTKKPITCNHCKKSGHVKSQCYRLHGFPSDFKFTKSKRDDNRSSAQNVISTSIHLLQLLQTIQMVEFLKNNIKISWNC